MCAPNRANFELWILRSTVGRSVVVVGRRSSSFFFSYLYFCFYYHPAYIFILLSNQNHRVKMFASYCLWKNRNKQKTKIKDDNDDDHYNQNNFSHKKVLTKIKDPMHTSHISPPWHTHTSFQHAFGVHWLRGTRVQKEFLIKKNKKSPLHNQPIPQISTSNSKKKKSTHLQNVKTIWQIQVSLKTISTTSYRVLA